MTPESFSLAGLTPLAYIGPGAGFAFLGSFLILTAALGLAFLSILFFPIRVTIHALRRWKRKSGKQRIRRVVVLGLDGLDPQRLRELMQKGELPNFRALAERGTFSELQSTCPPMSPVAWSSFATGVNPGKHNIFDFLSRDLKTYLPQLSSSRIRNIGKRHLWSRKTPEIELLRKSQPFWKILGEHGIFSTILRVPITFPPEKFSGLCLSAMCVPDLRGTQGAFTFYTTSPQDAIRQGLDAAGQGSEGLRIVVEPHGHRIETHLPGPAIQGKTLQNRMVIDLDKNGAGVTLTISGRKIRLQTGRYSEWTPVKFQTGLMGIHGICRFLLISAKPDFRLYVTPIHLDPEYPPMPISHPGYYSIYLAKLHGPFATLGLAEDTWGLTEGILTDAQFLQQTYDIHAERKAMFFEALKRTRTGMCCCVFDLPDRVQHMFFRYVDALHRAGKGTRDPAESDPVTAAYREMDDLLGKTLTVLGQKDVLFVMSDHGFASFRRNVHINRWLKQEGYLAERQDVSNRDYLMDVDWDRTRAYSFGLAGIYLNLKGREAKGIVADSERQALAQEIADKLLALKDPESGETVVQAVYDSQHVYAGPYRDNGPDLVVGYKKGYRVSWETAKGQVAGELFSDNMRPWSGDHCIDAALVPGVLLSNWKVNSANGKPHIMDIAPTILDLFGIPKPSYMDGHILETRRGKETHE
jgi:predicted AlkP superfamily phosphohydrolase/phosphomutase